MRTPWGLSSVELCSCEVVEVVRWCVDRCSLVADDCLCTSSADYSAEFYLVWLYVSWTIGASANCLDSL